MTPTPKPKLPMRLDDTYYEPAVIVLPWVVAYRLLPEEVEYNKCGLAKFGVMNGKGETGAVFESIADILIEMSKQLIAVRSYIFDRN